MKFCKTVLIVSLLSISILTLIGCKNGHVETKVDISPIKEHSHGTHLNANKTGE